MGVLDVVDPSECDEHGVPLDWERCRRCRRCGGGGGVLHVENGRVPCHVCGGLGSLKAAALMHLTVQQRTRFPGASPYTPLPPEFRVRCEDCGHPMSDGVFEGDQPYFGEDMTFSAALDVLRAGIDPANVGDGNCTHYSPCDEGCRHAGPGRVSHDGGQSWRESVFDEKGRDMLATFKQRAYFEASWRQVDVRTLGWPHDLRPEKLAIVCLRCWAARS